MLTDKDLQEQIDYLKEWVREQDKYIIILFVIGILNSLAIIINALKR